MTTVSVWLPEHTVPASTLTWCVASDMEVPGIEVTDEVDVPKECPKCGVHFLPMDVEGMEAQAFERAKRAEKRANESNALEFRLERQANHAAYLRSA